MRRVNIALLISMCLPVFLFSQQLKIGGVVNDISSNTPIENVTISLISSDSLTTMTRITNKQGKFELSGINRGSYQLILSCIGYQQSVILLKDMTKSLNLGILGMEPQSIDRLEWEKVHLPIFIACVINSK